MKPLEKIPTDPSKSWFSNISVGRNRLDCMLKEMCQHLELLQQITVYMHMVLPLCFVLVFLVQQWTGHRSLQDLHQCKRSSDKQLLDVSNIMSGNTSSTLSQVQNETASVYNNFRGTFTGCLVAISGKANNQNINFIITMMNC